MRSIETREPSTGSDRVTHLLTSKTSKAPRTRMHETIARTARELYKQLPEVKMKEAPQRQKMDNGRDQ